MKGIAPIIMVAIILMLLVGGLFFLNVGKQLKNINSTLTLLNVFNFTGNFNQSLNTSDSVMFKNVNITQTLNASVILIGNTNVGSNLTNLQSEINGKQNLINQSLNTSDSVLFYNENITNNLLTYYINSSSASSLFEKLNVRTDINFLSQSEGGTTIHRISPDANFQDSGNNGDELDIFSGLGADDTTSGGGGSGGNLQLTSGSGGNSNVLTGQGGNGGILLIQSGNGGSGTNPTQGFGGNAGDLEIFGGNAGTGGGGSGGRIIVTAGQPGTGNLNGANIYMYGGTKSGSGNNGNVLLAVKTSSTLTGRVGIGTVTPLAGLDVRGFTLQNQVQITGNVSIIGTGSNLTVTGKIAVNGQLAKNYTINANGNINASAYVTNGSDYAEVVPKLLPASNMTSGDIVAIRNGKASKITGSGNDYFVVSEKAGILSGDAGLWDNKIVKFNVTHINESTYNETTGEFLTYVTEEFNEIAVQKTDYTGLSSVPIAFIGQVNVKINGTCSDGNWVIPTGNNDGTGKCIDPAGAGSLAQYIAWNNQKVCTAWADKVSSGVSKINCALTSGG